MKYYEQHSGLLPAPIVEKPIKENYNWGFAHLLFEKDLEVYNNWLSKKIEVLPQHADTFKAFGDIELVEGVHYTTMPIMGCCDDGEPFETGDYIVIPTANNVEEGLKRLRNYFGENDRTPFEHWAFTFLTKLSKSVAIPKQQDTPVSEVEERILCAAIYFNDGKEYPHQPKNIETGFVVAGRRHSNCYATLSAIGKALGLEERALFAFERIDRDNQGFITNLNRYVNRKEAFEIAKKAGQCLQPDIINESIGLTSEDLY